MYNPNTKPNPNPSTQVLTEALTELRERLEESEERQLEQLRERRGARTQADPSAPRSYTFHPPPANQNAGRALVGLFQSTFGENSQHEFNFSLR